LGGLKVIIKHGHIIQLPIFHVIAAVWADIQVAQFVFALKGQIAMGRVSVPAKVTVTDIARAMAEM
jgi:hypothetical protein